MERNGDGGCNSYRCSIEPWLLRRPVGRYFWKDDWVNMAYVWSRGIAVPVSNVKNIVDRLTHGENIKRAYLGITSNTIPLPSDIAAQVQIRQDAGVLVFSVEAESPAKRAGLEFGDIIVKFNDKSVTNVDDLPRMLTKEVVGKATKLGILRGGKLRGLTIVPIAAGVEV